MRQTSFLNKTALSALLLTTVCLLASASPLNAQVQERVKQGKEAKSVVVPKKVVAYVPNWIDLKAFADTIDYARITHINLAFENPTDAAGTLSYNAVNDVLIARAHARHVKVLVSLGGGLASEQKDLVARYFDLIGDAKRAGFAAGIADYVERHHLDGVDVDIEGPSINGDYGAFVHALALALKPKHRLLTAALSQGYGGAKVPDTVFADLDFLNIMAYDALGSWNPNQPGQHASLAFAQDNVTYWLGRGVPKSKAVLGVPFYGYGFGTAFRQGEYPYSEIVTTYPGAEKVDQIGTTIWYNGVATIQAKAKYVMEQGLGGLMIWSLDSDAKGERSLLTALSDALQPTPAGPSLPGAR